ADGGRAHERAAVRPRLDRHVGGAAGDVLGPGEEPLGPAVVPVAGLRGRLDRDRVAGNGHLVVGFRIGRRQVHAAVADVGGALVDDRPRGRVVVVAAEGEPHGPFNELVVVAGGAFLASAA